MLDDILEFVFELFVEGVIEFFPMLPRPIRIFILCTLLIVLFGGSGLLIGFGIAKDSAVMLFLGIVILFVTIIWFVYLARKYRSEKHLNN